MHRMVRQSARRLMNTNFFGIAGSVIASQEKNPVISSCAAISTSPRKTPMFTIQTSGMGPSWLRRANALRLENYAKSGYAIRFESITRKANFTVGGIIRCVHFERNRGLRIDAVLASDALAKRCSAAGIDFEMRKGKEPSDHAPVWAEFRD